MIINIKIMAVIIEVMFNVTKHVKSIINNLMILIKVFIYIIGCLNLLSLCNIFNNIHKILSTMNNIIKIIIIIYIIVKLLYTVIIKLINRL